MRAGYLKIVDHNGQPIRAQASYEAAQFGRRLNTWGTSSAGPDTSLLGSLSTLRSRARELVRNDLLAGGGMDTLVANLIGTGITPRWLLDTATLNAIQPDSNPNKTQTPVRNFQVSNPCYYISLK